MPRLPVPGQDSGSWGNILNDFLLVSLNGDGSLKASAVATKADDSAVVHVTGAETIAGTKTFLAPPLVPAPSAGGHAANKTYVDSVASVGAPDATASTKGVVQLAGDLAGAGSAAAAPVISANAITTAKIATGAVTSNEIANGTILDADISASAAIAKTKLAALNIGDADVSAISESKITNLTTDLNAKVAKSSFTAKGDLLVASTSGTPASLTVGSDAQILTADSSQTTGVKWAPAPSSNTHNVTTTTGPTFTITTSHEVILVNATSAPVTLTLPTAVGNTNMYHVKKTDSSTNSVTVGTTASQTIDGGATAVIRVQYASINLVSNGSNWLVV